MTDPKLAEVEQVAYEILTPYFDMLDALCPTSTKMNRPGHVAKLVEAIRRLLDAKDAEIAALIRKRVAEARLDALVWTVNAPNGAVANEIRELRAELKRAANASFA